MKNLQPPISASSPILCTAVLAIALHSSCTQYGTACKDVSCSGHGFCGIDENQETYCSCDEGYYADGLNCRPADPCAGVDCGEEAYCRVIEGEPYCVVDLDPPCENVTCSGHGKCRYDQEGMPVCICDPGYQAEGLNCVENTIEPCNGIDCGGHGACFVNSIGQPDCDCDEGYHEQDLICMPDAGNPCEGENCGGYGICHLDDDGQAYCLCIEGYYAQDLTCLPESPHACYGVSCGHGYCLLDDNDQPYCHCYDGYHAQGLTCVPDSGYPCDGVDCLEHGYCIVENGFPTCVCEEGYLPDGINCLGCPGNRAARLHRDENLYCHVLGWYVHLDPPFSPRADSKLILRFAVDPLPYQIEGVTTNFMVWFYSADGTTNWRDINFEGRTVNGVVPYHDDDWNLVEATWDMQKHEFQVKVNDHANMATPFTGSQAGIAMIQFEAILEPILAEFLDLDVWIDGVSLVEEYGETKDLIVLELFEDSDYIGEYGDCVLTVEQPDNPLDHHMGCTAP